MDDLREVMARGFHEHLSRRDVMQYLDNEEDCDGLADAALAAIKQAGFVVVRESEAQLLTEATLFLDEVDGDYRTRMPDNFLWRLDQFNARRAMIEASNAPT